MQKNTIRALLLSTNLFWRRGLILNIAISLDNCALIIELSFSYIATYLKICAKIKISPSDFSNLKFGKKVNISRDWSIDIGRI